MIPHIKHLLITIGVFYIVRNRVTLLLVIQ
ncbi:hypothetical protein [Staphylococcus phage vB_SauM-V1SA22]|nr:hypothetical protein [Staphylococcus phage vB_SauM-V1SA19]UVD42699.1 hypothetical protein [Staphylococcus phage vB_SauM-V1SA22]